MCTNDVWMTIIDDGVKNDDVLPRGNLSSLGGEYWHMMMQDLVGLVLAGNVNAFVS